MADARRGIKDSNLSKIGATFNKLNNNLQDIMKRKCKISTMNYMNSNMLLYM